MIDIKNVSKWYGSFQVLTDCSTSIQKGEVVVVCGPSGSGKTTFLRLVSGLEDPTSGRVFLGGRDVTDLSTRERRVGVVFHG